VKLMTLRYAVSLVSDDNGTVLVTVPDLPDALTFGEDRDDALARAIDAIESALMGRMAAREEISHPRTDGPDLVTLPALTSAKVEIYRLMRKAGIGKADMARRLGVALPQIDRMLDLRHRSRLDFLERAFRALGYSLDLRVKKAA
jgi:antitoxin HicB